MLALVDSGTTRTRLRVWDGQAVVFRAERPVGAGDVARSGGPAVLLAALAELLAEARTTWAVEALVCSGMITSEAGLMAVAHVNAPADAAALAGGVVRADFPELAGVPCYFIPGVRTLAQTLNRQPPGWDTLDEADVMRGEEVQVLGLRETLRLGGSALFLSLGSHHKLVWTSASGEIVRSRTALTGELLAAVASHTLLSSSVGTVAEWPTPRPELWRSGLEAARQHGLGRALFLVRLGQLTLGAGSDELSAYMQGAAASLTLELLPAANAQPLILFGSGALALLAEEVGRLGWSTVRLISPQAAETASIVGAEQVMIRYVAQQVQR